MNREKIGKVWKVVMPLVMLAVLLLARHNAWAFSLGIAGLDDWLTSLEDGIPRCGLLMALVGGAAITLAKFENHFNSFFSGYINYFVTAGVFGGLATILTTIGIVG
jgi:hypothetical protein